MAKDLNKEIKKLEEKEKNDNFLRFQKKKTAEIRRKKARRIVSNNTERKCSDGKTEELEEN